MTRCILGIDPGAKGGLALVSYDRRLLAGIRMPTMQRRGKPIFSPGPMFQLCNGGATPDRVIIENVHSMPRQGVASAFQFGRMAGAVEATAAMLPGSPALEWVTPAAWKKAMSLTSSKGDSLAAAALAFPYWQGWDVKANDGIAEAALMCLWYLDRLAKAEAA